MYTLQHIVAPVVAAYLVFALAVLASWRGGDAPTEPARTTSEVLVTIVGGFAMFLVIVIVFHVVLVGDRMALRSALTGGIALLAIVVVGFVGLSWIHARVRRR